MYSSLTSHSELPIGLSKHALGVLLHHSLTASCAVRWQLLKLRIQLTQCCEQVLSVHIWHTAEDKYMTVYTFFTHETRDPSLPIIHSIFSDSCSCASTTRTGIDATVFHTCIRNYGHLVVDFCVKTTLSDRSSRFVATPYLPKQQPLGHSFPNTFLTWLGNSFYIQIAYDCW